MCGIAGLFFKNGTHPEQLGPLFTPMLAKMESRGADSVGFAIYGDRAATGSHWLTLGGDVRTDWAAITGWISERLGRSVIEPQQHHTHAVYEVPQDSGSQLSELEAIFPVVVMSTGTKMRIFKEAGSPTELLGLFGLSGFRSSHAIGHTRMATESAVITAGAHPFSTGEDFCLVHNGSLSNHHWIKRKLERQGLTFRTENDSEVAAGFLSWRLREGDSLEAAVEAALRDLDGFFTFCIGTANGFAVLRDPIACKPAVLVETDDYVAMASEYRSLADLPGASQGRIWEPAPGTVYAWEFAHDAVPASLRTA